MRQLVFLFAVMAFSGTALGAGPAPAPAKPGAPAAAGDTGTNVFGDDESPLGLDITPWKENSAQSGLDRPARLLEESPARVDPDVFERRIDYYDTITAYRKEAIGGAAPAK
jgi:hypothetical protein